MIKHFILATAGHVDHGKSSLVKALTGTDPDRLPEEKARGITIDLGFAHLDLLAPDHSGSSFHLGIVDVPGHEDFIKNMVAGVGSVDIALLVVAADDGWMPQTEEHLQILTYLRVARLVVALTKIDLPDIDRDLACRLVREKLEGTPFAQAPVIPVSAATRTGIEDLKSALVSVLSQVPPPRDIGKPRLPVDRAFSLRGIGTVVTGSLAGGSLHVGQSVVIQPSGQAARVRNIQSHNQNVSSASPGTRTALNLAEVGIAEQGGVRRGEVVTLAGLGKPVERLDVLLTRSARTIKGRVGAHGLRHGEQVRIHHQAGSWTARLLLVEGTEVGPGQKAIARLGFSSPVLAFVNDRFIVRDASEQATLAGGVILDTELAGRRFRDRARRVFLERCARAIHDLKSRLAAQLEYEGITRCSGVLANSNFSSTEIGVTLRSLADENKCVVLDDLAADWKWWTALRERAISEIDQFHGARPEHPGMPLTELRSNLAKTLSLPGSFEALTAALLKDGFSQVGAAIKRATHRPALPPHLQAVGARLRSALAVRPLEPPSRNELAREPAAQQGLRFLIQTGEVVELDPETVMTQEGLVRATETIKGYLAQHGPASVSQLRQAVGTTRRIIVPLLERLDRNGVTLRQGDQRVLRQT